MRLPLTRFENIAPIIISLLLLVRPGGYIVNLSVFYSYKLIGKLTAFLQLQEFSLRNITVPVPLPPRGVLLTDQIQSRTDPCQGCSLRITLNLDGAPITYISHTHTSHSQTSRLLTSSLSLGVPVPRATQCM
jgi:hypothetical protein